jgi:hypothetical protein
MTLVKKTAIALRLGRTWVRTGVRSQANAGIFEQVEHYCMFIGYPRSGHTLIGALLDAHPEVVLGHETAAMQHLWARFDRNRLFQMILDSAQEGGEHRWVSTGGEYVYHVEGMWQGRFQRLRVIGDKQAEGATLRIRANPELLSRLRQLVREPRILHVIRHPFDNITTIANRAAGKGGTGKRDLESAADRYFALCKTVSWIRGEINSCEVLTVYHEDFVDDPSQELLRICRWLGLDAHSSYLHACASIVRAKPNRSRDALPWSPEFRAAVRRRMEEFGFLERYLKEA